jgi:hypothetical protein
MALPSDSDEAALAAIAATGKALTVDEAVTLYFHQRGLSGAGLQQETSRVLGGFATIEGVAHGFRSGLRFLSLMMLAIGSTVAILLTRAGKGLRAPPGSGFL